MRQQQDAGVSASKVNRYEIEMVVKTVGHLLLQGYRPDQARKILGGGRTIESATGDAHPSLECWCDRVFADVPVCYRAISSRPSVHSRASRRSSHISEG